MTTLKKKKEALRQKYIHDCGSWTKLRIKTKKRRVKGDVW